MASIDVTRTHLQTLTVDDLRALADRLFGRGVSSLVTSSTRDQRDQILASRVIRELLRRYEHAVGRELQALMVVGYSDDLPEANRASHHSG